MNWDAIKAIVLDIDGVLTDGGIGYCGDTEVKFFHVRDGHGIKLAMRAGLKVGILSGRSSVANRVRAAELGMDFIYEGKKDKRAAFAELLAEQGLKAGECLYVGDDVVDIPVLRLAGIAVTVADAPAMMDDHCHMRTSLGGGRGAVREVIDLLLKKQGKWDALMERYLS